MADVTLGDYAGFILLEIIKARELADAYSRTVADRYAGDAVLQHFPVPRFRVPKLELTIPVLISGARYTQSVRFGMSAEDFLVFVRGHIDDSRKSVQIEQLRGRPIFRPIRAPILSRELQAMIAEFYEDLVTNSDPLNPQNIVTLAWSQIFRQCLADVGLLDEWQANDPNGNLLIHKTRDVIIAVNKATVIDRTVIDSLLINPETSIVKNGSSDATVFTIKAEIMEEAFFIRSVRDEESGDVRSIVEFE